MSGFVNALDGTISASSHHEPRRSWLVRAATGRFSVRAGSDSLQYMQACRCVSAGTACGEIRLRDSPGRPARTALGWLPVAGWAARNRCGA